MNAADRHLFGSGGVLSSFVQYTHFSGYGHGQGPEEMQVTPDGWGGNFFNAFTRTSQQMELRETFQFRQKQWHGRHELELGGDSLSRSYHGTSHSMPVDILRADASLAEQITFSSPGALRTSDNDIAIFAQDHWILSDRLALDLGYRISGQTAGKHAALAPRLGLVYAPGANAKTIVRGGFGVFYDRVPLLAGSFVDSPTRTVTMFDAQGLPLGPPVTFQNAYAKVGGAGPQLVAPGHDLDSTPDNLTWNSELDRQLRPHVLARFSYLSSRTHDLFVVGPEQSPGANPMLLMTNNGASHYHEFEATLRVRPSERADLNISFVRSTTRGDLNALSDVFIPFEQPIIRTNSFTDLPSHVPNRFVAWGVFKIPWKMTASPVLDVHTGFPYSEVDELQNYVGQPDGYRLPTLAAVDLRLTRDFRISFLPWLKNHKVRGHLAIYNITNHENPRDIYNNIASPNFGRFAGLQDRMCSGGVDVVY